MAFVSGRYGNPHIFRADLEWKSPTEVRVVGEQRLTFVGWYNAVPAWSPSSDRIAFAGYDRDIDRFDLFIMDPFGKSMERLTLKTGDNESPSWSPNGQLIAFHSNRTNGENKKSVAQIFVMNSDGSSQRQLNTGLYEAQTPKWSGVLD
jgi:TolB protein